MLGGQGIRPSGRYVRVRGEWFNGSGPYDHEQLVSVWASRRQAQTNHWVGGRAGDGGFFNVTLGEVDQLCELTVLCSYRGGGPFTVSGVKDADGAWVRGAVPADSPGCTALIYYAGEDWAWAEQLEHLEAHDAHSALGYCVEGWVPLSELSECHEIVKDLPIPGRNEGGERDAFHAVAAGLLRLMQDGDSRIVYLASMTAPVTYQRVRAFNPDGRHTAAEGPFRSVRIPSELSAGLGRLRTASSRTSTGTWFSVRITVNADGSATAVYNHDEEPEWDVPVDPIVYVTDQEKFPRDESHQPEWLKQRLAEGRARRSSISPGEPVSQEDDDHAALRLIQLVGVMAKLQSSEKEGLLVSLWDMEMRYTITSNSGLFVVQSSDRGTAPWLEMASESLPVAARGLILMLAPLVRRNLRLPSITNKLNAPGMPEGAALEEDVDGLRLRWNENGEPCSAWFPDSIAGRRSAARFAHVAQHSLDELVRSLQSSSGAPLFA